MNTTLKLNSVTQYGVGSGSESIAIDLIYSYLLNKTDQNIYRYITINQIGDDLEEFVKLEGKSVHINIQYLTTEDFKNSSPLEKNKTRLDIIHEALSRIALIYKKLEVDKLNAIKRTILDQKFSFDIVYKKFKHRRIDLVAKVIIHPDIDNFKCYVVVEKDNKEKCKLLIYKGKPAVDFKNFFSHGKWKNENELIISGTEKEIEIHINIDTCIVTYVNKTMYKNPPIFEMMKAEISKKSEEEAYKDWIHSLPPEIASAIRDRDN